MVSLSRRRQTTRDHWNDVVATSLIIFAAVIVSDAPCSEAQKYIRSRRAQSLQWIRPKQKPKQETTEERLHLPPSQPTASSSPEPTKNNPQQKQRLYHERGIFRVDELLDSQENQDEQADMGEDEDDEGFVEGAQNIVPEAPRPPELEDFAEENFVFWDRILDNQQPGDLSFSMIQ